MTLESQIAILQAENAAYKQQVKDLEEKVELLLELLGQKSTKKTSRNSHNPPSQDKAKPKRNQSLRKKTGRKSGGQPGHKGHFLRRKENPDESHDVKSDYCNSCGEDLREEKHELVSKRQVIELPPIQPIYVEYCQWGCVCKCGHKQLGTYPKGVNAPIQYGTSIIALVSYMNVFQYVPYARLKKLFTDVFNLPISEGSIENLLNKGAKKSQFVYQKVLDQIKVATYVGSDETGAKVDGEKWWIWVWQNLKNTFLKASKSRGFDTIEDSFPEGLPNATVGSDRWAAQLKMNSKNKQLCIPHLQRDLNFLEDDEKHEWSRYFKVLLKQALNLRYTTVDQNKAYTKGAFETYQLERRLNRLLARSIIKSEFPKTAAFQKSMIKHRNYLFLFLYDLEIPPDNNASERAIRNVKVKQKISGQFKSGQDTFCILRSVIDTLQKRDLNVLSHLNQIMMA